MNMPIRTREQAGGHMPPGKAGAIEPPLEDAALSAGTNGVYWFSRRHPWLYGIIAFILGGAVAAFFIIREYGNWTFEGVRLATAVYVLVFGCLATAIVATIAAFIVARMLRPAVGQL